MGKWKRVRSHKRRWQRNHLFNKYGDACYICLEPFKSLKDSTFDHYVPLSKGGADELLNLRLAHLECNKLKGNMTPQQFYEYQVGAITWEQ